MLQTFKSMKSFKLCNPARKAPSIRYFTTAIINFNDAKHSLQVKSTADLIRAYVVFGICQTPILVKNAEILLKFSYQILGHTITNTILKKTFFGHFCAGENEKLIQSKVDYLKANGVGSILDYASESDIAPAAPAPSSSSKSNNQSVNVNPDKSFAQCRVYDYKDEVLCDTQAKTFEACIRAVANVSPTGFAAIKCTALGNPTLLEAISTIIVELKSLFQKFDVDKTGRITKDQFIITFNEYFISDDASTITKAFNQLDIDGDGFIDYIEWSNVLAIEQLHMLPIKFRDIDSSVNSSIGSETGSSINNIHQTKSSLQSLKRAILNKEELLLFKQMRRRIYNLTALAKSLNVRLMIDAEHTYFQPAIDYIATDLQRSFNDDYPVVFTTYQLYLKDSKYRLFTDIQRAQNGGYKFAAKLVRGAYMKLERERAKRLGYEDPIYTSIEDTHQNYNECVKEIISLISQQQKSQTQSQSNVHPSNDVTRVPDTSNNCSNTTSNLGSNIVTDNHNTVEIMIASHNQQSIELATTQMHALQLIPTKTSVYFGQLLGMSDTISFTLGHAGYKVYKYVPYGKVSEVMPYLIRRAQENADALSGAKNEMMMIRKEIIRRILFWFY